LWIKGYCKLKEEALEKSLLKTMCCVTTEYGMIEPGLPDYKKNEAQKRG
jgi:hypothetical protein